MAEFANNALQTVLPNNPVELITVIPCNKGYVVHREGSGILTLRSPGPNCLAQYLVLFNANIALSEGATVGPISIALTIDGEILKTSTATVTPAAVGDFFNVSFSEIIQIPKGCCNNVSVENITANTSIDIQNSNLIIRRIA